LFLRDQGETEVGGFGISADDDPLYVTDVRLIRQSCTQVSVRFEDAAVADFFDEQVDSGRAIGQVGRIWIHTHPGDSAAASRLDEATFRRVFGRPDWAVMFILARDGETYGRLRFNVGPGAELVIRTEVEFGSPFAGSDPTAWLHEYCEAVRPEEVKTRSDERAAEPRWIPHIPDDLGGFEPEDLIWG
jgi:proteasome lid subunit RPN8/RPN11